MHSYVCQNIVGGHLVANLLKVSGKAKGALWNLGKARCPVIWTQNKIARSWGCKCSEKHTIHAKKDAIKEQLKPEVMRNLVCDLARKKVKLAARKAHAAVTNTAITNTKKLSADV